MMPSLFDNLQIASPCRMEWNTMMGDERVRFCAACRLNVYNLSGMMRTDAEALLLQTEGRVCVRFFQRADGTVMTRDCPVGARIARRLRWAKAAVMSAVAVALAAVGLKRLV